MIPLAEVHDRVPTLDSTGILSLFLESPTPSFGSFPPCSASAERKNGTTGDSRYPLCGLVAAPVLLGQAGEARHQAPSCGVQGEGFSSASRTQTSCGMSGRSAGRMPYWGFLHIPQ